MSSKNNSKLIFEIEMDENKVPEKISWEAENQEKSECKAFMTSLWDDKDSNTMRIDLWTKGMMIEEMRHFFVQSLITMADTFERATNDAKSAEELREFSQKFGKKLGVIKDI
jgi:gliding motility-associated protein GldC